MTLDAKTSRAAWSEIYLNRLVLDRRLEGKKPVSLIRFHLSSEKGRD